MDTRPLYTATGVFSLRAPTLGAHSLANLDGTATTWSGTPAERRLEGRKALLTLVSSPRVERAIHVASPSLGRTLRELTESDEAGKDQGRAFSALLRYLTRMSTRPTPFGMFAGVAVGGFGTRSPVELDDEPVQRIRTRADTSWLYSILQDVLADAELRDRLPVRANDLLYRTGSDLVLYRSSFDDGQIGDRVQVKANRLVDAALRLVEARPTFAELVDSLRCRFAGVEEARIRRLLGQLWDAGILISDLQLPLTEPLPERHLADQLRSHGVDADIVRDLDTMRALAADVERGGVAGGRTDDLSALTAHQRRMAPAFTGVTYRQDAILAATGELSSEIAEAAAEAAETLMRLGCVRTRTPHIVEYHQQFVERYGHGSELPLLEVLDPERGLGPPNPYLSPPRRVPLPAEANNPAPDRDRALVELVAYATRHDLLEVELDAGWFTELEVWRPEDSSCRPRTSLDLYFQLAAEGNDLTNGGWRIVLGTLPYGGGLQSFGRFMDDADERAAARIRDHIRAEERLRPDTVFAELTYHHTRWQRSNVAVHPTLRDYEICVNVPPTLPPERQLRLDDVVVGADSDHFYLRSARLGKRLQVSQTHALNPLLSPNVCRALLELSADGMTPQTGFDWGIPSAAPFLPRLTRGRTVVHPARWAVNRRTFPGDLDSADEFYVACQRWRNAWNVPRYVYLVDLDNRLLLDLEHPLWVDELHREVRRRQREAWPSDIALHEALPGPGDLWLRDRSGNPYHAEVTVPLVLREPLPNNVEARTCKPASVTRRWLPGDVWIHLKLYSSPDRHDAIIAGPLRSLVQELRGQTLLADWFYIRYVDPFPHLRLRFRATDAGQAADLMARCATWGRQLVETGHACDFGFASYDREIERYGGPEAIETVETVFARNSEVCADLVGLAYANPEDFDVEVLNVAALHAFYRDWGASPAFLRSPQTARRIDTCARERFRLLRPLLCELLAPGEIRPDPRASAYRDAGAQILHRQQAAVAAGGDRVRRLAGQGLLTGSEETVVDSLAHMQSNRLVGIDRSREQLCHDLWRQALRAIGGRPKSPVGS